MSVSPQLDPDELVPRTNSGSAGSYHNAASGSVPRTDPQQQITPSARPIPRQDPSQNTFRPAQLRHVTEQQVMTNMNHTSNTNFQPSHASQAPQWPNTPSEGGTILYSYPPNMPNNPYPPAAPSTGTQHMFGTPQTPASGIIRPPILGGSYAVPSNNYPDMPSNPTNISNNPNMPNNPNIPNMQRQVPNRPAMSPPPHFQVTPPGNATAPSFYSSGITQSPMQGQQNPMPQHENFESQAYHRRSGRLREEEVPRSNSGHLIDEMPTTRMAAIKELATMVVQPQQAANVIVQGETKKPTKKSWVGFVVRTAITVLIFFAILRGMDWNHLFTVLIHARRTYLLIGLSAGMLCVFFSAWGWQAAVRAENINADLSRLIALYLVGLGFSQFLPTSMGGDAVKAYYVGRDSGNMSGAASSALTTRITSFVGMLLIALPALGLFYSYFTKEVVVEFLLMSVLLLGAIATALILAAFLPKLTGKFLPEKIAKHRIIQKVLEVGIAMSLAAKKPRSMLPATFFGMCFWIASFLNYYGYAAALGIKVPLPFYVIAIPFVSIVTALPISVGGFGVREGTFVYLFTQIPLPNMHVTPDAALLLSLLMDAQVLFFGLIGGAIYFTMPKKEKISSAK